MLTLQGYDVRGEQEYYDAIIANLKTVFPTINEDKANYAIVMARMFARNEARRDQEIADLYSAAYVSTATGYSLDKAVWVAGIKRDAGNFSTGKVIITKVPTAPVMIIPAYSEIIVDNKIYITQNTSTINTVNSTYEVDIKANSVGTIYNIPSGAIFKFVVPNVNVQSIVASTNIAGGTNVETDEELRARFFYTLSSTKNSSLPSIIGQVASVNGVSYVNGRENTQHVDDENGLPPHSIEIQVSGGTDEDVAVAIAKTKAGGIKTYGNVTKTVNIDGIEYTVNFTRAQDSYVYYDITIVVDKYIVPQNINELIVSSIMEFTNNVNSIRKWDLDGDINQVHDSIIGVYSSYFGATENPITSDTITVAPGYKFITDETRITINLVEE